jgi:hypothetical protein
MGRSIRRHSTDAATLLRRAAGSVASAGSAIPGLAFFRQPWDYHYPPSDDEDVVVRVRRRAPSPDIDWIAAGRAYTAEDLDREYPPLAEVPDDSLRVPSRGRRSVLGDAPSSISRAHSAPVRGRHTRAARAGSDASDGSDDSEPHWDARRWQTPAFILERRYRPQGPVFEEPDEDVRAALARPVDRPGSTAIGLRPPTSRNASTTSNDTLPSLDSSFCSLESEGPATPDASVVLQPPTPTTADTPDGAVVIAPRPTKVWPRPPLRAYTGGLGVMLSSVSALTYSLVTHQAFLFAAILSFLHW